MAKKCSKCSGEIVSELTRQEYNAYNAYCEERYMTLSTVNVCECDREVKSYSDFDYDKLKYMYNREI